MRRTILLLSLVVLLLASCGSDTDEGQDAEPTDAPQASASASTTSGSPAASPTPELRTDYDTPPFDELVKMYDYDTSEPLGYEVIDTEREKGATVNDIEFQSSGYTVPGYLVIPEGKGPFPAVLYATGYGMDHTFFLEDALALARDGYAGLLILGPTAREPYVSMFSWDASRDVEGWVAAVIDHRRSLDLLETLPEVDAERIGYVGYSLGGLIGGILSGLDERVDGYVLTAAGGYSTDAVEHVDFGSGPPPYGDALTSYQDAVAVVNPVNFVGENEGAAFLFQGSESDEYVSVENFQAYLEAAPEPKSLEWYSGGHDLECPFIFGGESTSCGADTEWLVFHRAWLQENV